MMNEQLDWQWQAVQAKNREFDGVFYFGVQSTGIFCRPSCSSRTPKRHNVSFFITPTEAETAGFRACLRCKPKQELAPGPAATLVSRAFHILQEDTSEIPTIDALAARLEVSSGHLQKTFKTVLGLSPNDNLPVFRPIRSLGDRG